MSSWLRIVYDILGRCQRGKKRVDPGDVRRGRKEEGGGGGGLSGNAVGKSEIG